MSLNNQNRAACEVDSRRRLIYLQRERHGSNVALKLSPVLLEIARDLPLSEVITFAIPQNTGQEVSVYSSDILKLLQFALGLPGIPLSTEQMAIVRHEVDLHHTGRLQCGDEALKLLWLKGGVISFPLGLMTFRVNILERVITSIIERLVSSAVFFSPDTIANEGLGESVYFTARSEQGPEHLIFQIPNECTRSQFSTPRVGDEPSLNWAELPKYASHQAQRPYLTGDPLHRSGLSRTIGLCGCRG